MSIKKLTSIVLVWVAAVLSVPALLAAPASEKILANGMKVIVKEDHRSPVVVSILWYHIGSMDEVSGTSGVAHVLEHMMFKGTAKVAAGEFSKIIARAGGRDNAFTSRDYTGYFQQLHKSKLPLALELEADRMTNLAFSDEEFAKEIKVVMEERRTRTDDQPHALLHEQLMATAFTAHPYRWPVIGWMNDLQNLRAEHARDWYRKWYAPNNATLVVAGDVQAQAVFDLASSLFESIPARPLPIRAATEDPRQLGIKRIVVKAQAELPYLAMAYRVPVLRDPKNDWEPYALSVLGGVLDGGNAARFERELVRGQRIAHSASSGYDMVNRGPGLFTLEGVPATGKTVSELEQALRAQVRRLIEEGIDEKEMQRVRAQVIAAQVFSQDSVFYQARRIGALETAGLPHTSADLQVAKLREVSAEQVREVAKKYLIDDNLTVAVLDPQPLPVAITHAK
ncbi:MAG: M16 family metallopeptidase [Burkholderiales bacterium]